ncbi:NACHT domain-containing protein [Phytohabitans houttuyneae]|uniref:NACHT domain-containing protein n=1 Tax=Phytohabitans houttuyneae TaxID=1076126 RepID=A0A6V8K261_9ACTN|nr:NACHT domain-containing protein [Phytohabitans houttuyneae]GFJ77784.1 hypothetical protein Phou_019640 [Phytohabitans houttuyneae]
MPLSPWALAPTPTAPPGQSAGGVPVDVVVALIALAGVLVSAALGFWQWRRSQAAQRALEAERAERERDRLRYEDQLSRERALWDDSRQAAREVERVEEAALHEARRAAAKASDLRQSAEHYRTLLVEELRRLKILDMSKPLDLEALYVQLQVREEATRFASQEEMEALAQGTPERLLELSAKHAKDAQATAMRPEDAVRRFGRFVVLGDPGAGKTTMLRHLALRTARGEITPALTLPIYVELREFVDSGMGDVIAYAAHSCEHRYGFTGALDHLHEQLATGRAALLLDGLDEVLGGGSADEAERAYQLVAAEVDRIATRFPGAPIAVTCRRAGWRGGLRAFQVLDVLDFAWPQIVTFVENWFAADRTRAAGLKGALQANVRMSSLAANPLILSLVAIVYERDLELPERRAKLYDRCVEVLLKEWDSHRGIRRFGRFTTDRKRDLLEEIAWHFHGLGLRYYPERDLLAVIEDFLPTIDIEPAHAREILDEIAAQYGLLKIQATGWYGFLHLTLQEYFAAVSASERGPDAVAAVVAHRHDPWWEEVLLLLAGRAADASGLLLGVLGRDPTDLEPPAAGEPLAADDDILRQDLMLAARCLIGTPKVNLRWLRPAIIDATYDWMLSTPSESVAMDAARVLVSIGGRMLHDRLLDCLADREVAMLRRAWIADALGDSGSVRIAAALTGMLASWDLDRDEDDAYPATYMVRAIRRIGYAPAGDVLVGLLSGPRVDYNYNWSSTLAEAIATLAGASGAQRLLEVSDNVPEPTRYTRNDLIRGLKHSRDVATGERLLARIPSAPPEDVGAYVTAALGILGPAAARHVLDSLLKRSDTGWLEADPAALSAFTAKPSPDLVVPLTEAISDRRRAPELRWALVSVLEALPESVPTLLEIISRDAVDLWTRLCAATALGSLQHDAGRPALREALDELADGRLDGLWALGDYAIAPRIASAMVEIGDEALVQRKLVSMVQEVLSSASDRYDLDQFRLDTLLPALALTNLGRISKTVNDLIQAAVTADGILGTTWAEHIARADSVPVLLGMLRPETHDKVYAGHLLRIVARVVDDVQHVPQLLTLRQDPVHRGRVDDVFAALSRRCQVRIFEDGRVVEVRQPPA